MHIIVMAIGSDGDVNPMLEIAGELKSRGHSIDFFANGYFEEKVRERGFGFVALGEREQYELVVRDKNLWEPRKAFKTIWNNLKNYLLIQYQLVEEHIKPGETAMLSSSLAFSTRLIQEKLGLKLSTVHLAPSVILSREKPPFMPGVQLPDCMPTSIRYWGMTMIDRYALDGVTKDDLNSIREELGLWPVRKIMTEWMHSPDQVLLAFPEWFAEAQLDWPKNHKFVGFPVYKSPPTKKLSEEVQSFLEAGEKPLLFTAGSAMAHSSEFFKVARAAAEELDRRAIFVNKFDRSLDRGSTGTQRSERYIYSEYEPFDLLFEKVSCVTHHGGIGTSAQALSCGIPQLVMPFAHDQFDNADRLESANVGLRARKLDLSEWKSSLSTLFKDETIKQSCEEKAKVINSAKPAKVLAAEAVEKLGV